MKQRAVVVSIAIHVAAAVALLALAPKHISAPLGSVAIEFDIIDQQTHALMPSPVLPVPEVAVADAAPTPVRQRLRRAQPLRGELTQDRNRPEALLPEGVPVPQPSGEAPSPQVDRLWSLRPVVPSVPPHPLGKPTPEDPKALFRHAAPNVIKNPRQDGPLATIEGRGGVKMKVGEDGRIEGFAQPEARLNGLGAVFDLNDTVIRALGGNPYRYEEHRLAEATREQRVCQMVEAARRDTREAVFNLKHRLASLWSLTDLSLPKRRASLSPPSTLNSSVVFVSVIVSGRATALYLKCGS